jgi:hypothetical protein
MNRTSADARKRQEELIHELRHIAEEIRPLTDSVDSLYILLQHIWQNREELKELLNAVPEDTERDGERLQSGGRESLPPETLFCTCCDAVSNTTLALALRAGWQCIVDDEGNERGNYAGMCPGCIEEEEHVGDSPQERGERGTASGQAAQQRTLF